MPIFAKATGTNFAPAPAGTHAAVCVDVVDLGVIESKWNGKTLTQHKIKIVWQIEEDRDDGKPFQVSRRYTLSLHEKAGLRKDLESWRGRAFTDEELQGFDVETVIGVGCLLNVIHNVKDGSTYANVAGVMKLPKNMTSLQSRDYVRVCDRAATEGQPDAPPFGNINDDDVPF